MFYACTQMVARWRLSLPRTEDLIPDSLSLKKKSVKGDVIAIEGVSGFTARNRTFCTVKI